MTLILDTSGLYALLDASDRLHGPATEVFEDEPGPFVLPLLVVAEVDFLLLKARGVEAERLFLEDVVEGAYRLERPTSDDLVRALELVAKYPDLELGATDATVMACAERLGCPRVLTSDRRDFLAVTPREFAAFEVLL